MFLQDPPRRIDLYQADAPLRNELRRHLPDDVFEAIEPRLLALGEATAGELIELADQAEAELPVHVPYDPWGRRIDVIKTCAAWKGLKTMAATHGIVSTGYDESLGAHRRVVQAGVLSLYSASSAVFSCPLAMTDAAARVLIDHGTPELRDKLLPRLLSRDPAEFITSGQWMTEKTGGSDVGGTETIARPVPGDTTGLAYTLHGAKWFTSATTSEMALTLARIDDGVNPVPTGSRGLTVFAVEVERDDHGSLQGIQIERLKDKLGTRALPTAELTLDGVAATRIGEPGRGVPNIATMLNITRYYNAIASASGMARAVWMARDYATQRVAFGHDIADLPLHARTLDEMEADYAGAIAMSMELASLLGRGELGELSDEEARRRRALIPLCKLTMGKQAVRVASEALECFGGAGYMEDTGLPRLLRDAQTLPIWEGTTNVLSLDLLRSEGRDGAWSALLEDLGRRAADLPADLDGAAVQHVRALLGRLAGTARDLLASGERPALEAHARRLALTTGYCLQAVLLAETASLPTSDAAASARFRTFVDHVLAAPLGL
ncbi:MAG: acyl-CoA dehydrogenase [Proteobacteria bacterium]|nr:acyl-CoA dehydrogenase [Pseudomonadota bacterium]MCP4918136.1 acyl-CoA dehydrogenase [Pseudomonadota bacterium]